MTRKVHGTEEGLTHSDELYKPSYKIFCSNVILDEVIKQKKIKRMRELHKKFVKQVQITENIDASNYRVFRLKARLQRDYPQLVFHRPHARNQSQFVFVEEMSVGQFYESNVSNLEQSDKYSGSDQSTETSEEMEIGYQEPALPKEVTLKELYDVAIALRMSMNEVKDKKMPWPPISTDFSEEKVLQMIPVKLFNFISWCFGFSDTPEMDKHVKLGEEHLKKVLSICQDMLFINSNGRMQTPKSLALGMTVRQLTRSSQLTDILNGFGHCASRYAVLTHETDLAKLAVTSDSNIPKDIIKGKFTCLVFDNNDFAEESRNQTHVLGGIAIQKEGETGHDEQQPQPRLTKKGGRSLQAPETTILPFHLGKKKTPSFSYIGMESEEEDKYWEVHQDFARKLDFAYTLMKMYQSEVDLLPGWTGFNILVQGSNIPPVSRIRYLPIIDGSPSQYSTLYTSLQQSIKIADELLLERIVLVFDEAIYAKIQQIRWKDEILMSRFIVRLGDFHTTMSFLSGIGVLFRDAGLQVGFLHKKCLQHSKSMLTKITKTFLFSNRMYLLNLI